MTAQPDSPPLSKARPILSELAELLWILRRNFCLYITVAVGLQDLIAVVRDEALNELEYAQLGVGEDRTSSLDRHAVPDIVGCSKQRSLIQRSKVERDRYAMVW